ncbi:hypothetical protein BH20ACT19_BH20ACT19_08490 [soil metagenome]
MEGSTAQGSDPPPVADERGEQRVTRDDLKGLRRWTLVTGIWAVAATAVALIALLDTSGGDAEQKAGDAGRRVGTVEKRVDALDRDLRGLSARIDDAESRLGGLAPLTDVTKLQDRVGRAEEDASAANNRSGNVRDTVRDLEDRLTQLEDAPAETGGGSGGGGSGGGSDDAGP